MVFCQVFLLSKEAFIYKVQRGSVRVQRSSVRVQPSSVGSSNLGSASRGGFSF
jgi:hypothetical protein